MLMQMPHHGYSHKLFTKLFLRGTFFKGAEFFMGKGGGFLGSPLLNHLKKLYQCHTVIGGGKWLYNKTGLQHGSSCFISPKVYLNILGQFPQM